MSSPARRPYPLSAIDGPSDLRRLSPARLDTLAREIRNVLVETVCDNGGHLGPNLGAVELTVALHRTFRSPWDRIVVDTGHQARCGLDAAGIPAAVASVVAARPVPRVMLPVEPVFTGTDQHWDQ